MTDRYPDEVLNRAALKLALSNADPSDEDINSAIIEEHAVWISEHSSEILGLMNKKLEDAHSDYRAFITPDGFEFFLSKHKQLR